MFSRESWLVRTINMLRCKGLNHILLLAILWDIFWVLLVATLNKRVWLSPFLRCTNFFTSNGWKQNLFPILYFGIFIMFGNGKVDFKFGIPKKKQCAPNLTQREYVTVYSLLMILLLEFSLIELWSLHWNYPGKKANELVNVNQGKPFLARLAIAATALAGRYGIQAWQSFKTRPPKPKKRKFHEGGFQSKMMKREDLLSLALGNHLIKFYIASGKLEIIIIDVLFFNVSTIYFLQIKQKENFYLGIMFYYNQDILNSLLDFVSSKTFWSFVLTFWWRSLILYTM